MTTLDYRHILAGKTADESLVVHAAYGLTYVSDAPYGLRFRQFLAERTTKSLILRGIDLEDEKCRSIQLGSGTNEG